ncbi:MAG: phosphate acyltransferase PlsX [Armatimonadota bacterium]
MRIAVDAMGGDHAPAEIVRGAVEAAEKYGIPVVLVGDEGAVRAHLRGSHPGVEVLHASEVVGMDEHPASAIRRKSDSSIVVAGNLVKRGEAQAVVSAGNTGAAMAVGTLKIGRIKGIDRPAICSLLPTSTGKCILLDAGANVDCSVENLLQFAVMGNEYAAHVMKIERPRVGLLSIGEEPTKGDTLTQATNAELAKTNLNFIGNVEGKEIFRGAADVVVCDGFAGNIVLKIAEGVGELLFSSMRREIGAGLVTKIGGLLAKPAFRRVKAKIDYAEYGGAPLLGVNGMVIISHGRSDHRAIRNAIRVAAAAVENDVVGCIKRQFVEEKEITYAGTENR